MSVAELKEKIVKEVVLSNDVAFLQEVEAFLKEKAKKTELIDAQEFQDELFAAHDAVLKRLA